MDNNLDSDCSIIGFYWVSDSGAPMGGAATNDASIKLVKSTICIVERCV